MDGVSLRVEAGDSILLYGPNGAGKTTLLRVLSTLARPSEGKVLYDGADVLANPAAAKAAIGFVSHTTFLYGELTARENLEFAGKLFGLVDLAQRLAVVLDLFHLRERAETPVRELSRGYQQRVSLARAFLHDPQFLLLDEPFTGLDAASTESLQELMRNLRDQGKALIFSTHDFEQGRAIAPSPRGAGRREGGVRRADQCRTNGITKNKAVIFGKNLWGYGSRSADLFFRSAAFLLRARERPRT